MRDGRELATTWETRLSHAEQRPQAAVLTEHAVARLGVHFCADGLADGVAGRRSHAARVSGAITGAMSIGDMEIDKQGAVSKAEPAPREAKPIFDVVQGGSTLTCSRKDTTETDRFELRLLDKNKAELTFLITDEDRKELAAEGIPPPKPIALTRQ
jgi:hypothetical protein